MADRVSFADDSVLVADAVVVTTSGDALARVLVDTALRVHAVPEVFAAGDAAAADTGRRPQALQSSQHAGQLGHGENAPRDVLGLLPIPYTQSTLCNLPGPRPLWRCHNPRWERRGQKTRREGKAVKRLIIAQVVYPPADAEQATFSRYSNAKSSAVILWGSGEQAEKTTAHCFFRAEATTLRDPFNRQACVRKQTTRRFHPQPLNGTSRRLPSRLRVVPAETALAHPGLIGQNRKRKIAREMPIDQLLSAPNLSSAACKARTALNCACPPGRLRKTTR